MIRCITFFIALNASPIFSSQIHLSFFISGLASAVHTFMPILVNCPHKRTECFQVFRFRLMVNLPINSFTPLAVSLKPYHFEQFYISLVSTNSCFVERLWDLFYFLYLLFFGHLCHYQYVTFVTISMYYQHVVAPLDSPGSASGICLFDWHS